MKKLKDTSEAEILKWFAARPRIQEEAEFLFRSEIYGGNPPFTTLTGVHEFQFHGQFLMDGSVLVSGFSASFYAGSSFENIPLLTKVILALKFMGHHTRPALFGELSEEDRNLLKNHSFTKLDLVNAMEFAYLSYVHGISLLSNDRPEESSDEEWLKILLLPQEGESLSLLEKLSIILKPEVLGFNSMNGLYVPHPLELHDGKWTFSQDFKTFFRESQEKWRISKANSTRPGYELGTGCPAAFCHSEEQSSLRTISEVLFHVFKVVDQNFSTIRP